MDSACCVFIFLYITTVTKEREVMSVKGMEGSSGAEEGEKIM